MSPQEHRTYIRPTRIAGVLVVCAILIWSIGLKAIHVKLEAAKRATTDTRG